MTTRIITGSKREIADRIVEIEGDVREVVVFIDEPSVDRSAASTAADGSGDIFAEMDAHAVQAGGQVDYSRESIYTPQGEE
jgi:hypothetical protein